MATAQFETMTHTLLQQQISQLLPKELADDPRLGTFLEAVSATYAQNEGAKSSAISTDSDLERLKLEVQARDAQLLKAEKELNHVKQALNEAQEFASIGSYEIDFENQYSIFTPEAAKLLGLSVEELSNMDTLIKNLRRNVSKEDLERIDQVWEDAMKNQSDIRLDFKSVQPSGTELFIEWIAKAQFDENGRVRRIAGTIQDVTARAENESQMKAYSESLEKINRELDQFAYIVSHDLKAPLRAINNLSVWIEEDLEGKMDEGTTKNFELLRSRIKRMEALIEGILQYSRAGRVKAELHPIEVYDFVQDIVANLSPPSHFKVHVQEAMAVISMEKIAMEQVFANFISNAIKYNSSAEPEIRISYQENDSEHVFCVSDNGPGIEPEFHEKVFQIFQTLQSRDVMESTGVGLAIVKKIIEEKGGRVWLESEPGQGAYFYFSLPKNPA